VSIPRTRAPQVRHELVRGDLADATAARYAVTLALRDRGWSLDFEQAVAYATACSRVAAGAHHDAAAWSMLTNLLGFTEQDASALLRKSTAQRVTDALSWPTEGLHFEPGLQRRGPIVNAFLRERLVGTLTCEQLHAHAADVMAAAAAAEHDANLHTALLLSGASEVRVRQVVAELPTYWPRPQRGAARTTVRITED
jgi:hypothetical protein